MTGTSVAAAILAGGRARRYGGVVKSTLVLDGARIIDRQIAELRKVADPIFIVAQDPAPFASLGLVVVPDVVPDCGALGGIYTAIVRSPRPRTLVVAGDLPFLSPALLARLVPGRRMPTWSCRADRRATSRSARCIRAPARDRYVGGSRAERSGRQFRRRACGSKRLGRRCSRRTIPTVCCSSTSTRRMITNGPGI